MSSFKTGDKIGHLTVMSGKRRKSGALAFRCECGRRVVRQPSTVGPDTKCITCRRADVRSLDSISAEMVHRQYTSEELKLIEEYYERKWLPKENN